MGNEFEVKLVWDENVCLGEGSGVGCDCRLVFQPTQIQTHTVTHTQAQTHTQKHYLVQRNPHAPAQPPSDFSNILFITSGIITLLMATEK